MLYSNGAIEGGMQEYQCQGRPKVQAIQDLPSPISEKVEQEEI